MTNQEILNFNKELEVLANHLVAKGTDNFTLNYAVDANFRRLKPVIQGIQKAVSPELVAIEKKAYELAHKDPEERTEEEVIKEGLTLLTDEEREQQKALMVKYNEDMAQENTEFEVYKVDRKKIEDIKIDLPYIGILKKILYEDN